MKQKTLFKGIITLALILCIGFLTIVTASSATAFAGTAAPKLNVKSKSIVKGKDYALKVYNLTETQTVTFASANTEVASVDEAGVVTALSVGTTVVTATVEDVEAGSVELQCKITVGVPAIFIQLSRHEMTLVTGQRSLMYWLISPFNTVEQPKFSSSAPEIVSVSAGGVITAKSEGTAYIFAQIGNGQFDVCSITVTSAEVTSARSAAESEDAFADFLIKLNENFTSGDNTSENTGAEAAQ